MVWFVILSVITGGLALGLPPNPQTLQQLHISSVAYRIAILALLIPYGIIWYAGFYAFAKLKEYVHTIKAFEDGKAFRKITIGMGVLAFGLIIPTAISLILQTITIHHPGFKPASIIISNYMAIVVVLITFIYISSGARLLSSLTKNKLGLFGVRMFALLFISLAVVFTYLVLHYQARHADVYYLDTPLLIITFIIPYLYAWYMALLSAYELGLYARHAKGLLYRQALRFFSHGIVVTIVGSIAIQFVNNTFAAKAKHSLGAILVLEYILLAIVAIGLILMALGTKKLKRIEEV